MCCVAPQRATVVSSEEIVVDADILLLYRRVKPAASLSELSSVVVRLAFLGYVKDADAAKEQQEKSECWTADGRVMDLVGAATVR